MLIDFFDSQENLMNSLANFDIEKELEEFDEEDEEE